MYTFYIVICMYVYNCNVYLKDKTEGVYFFDVCV